MKVKNKAQMKNRLKNNKGIITIPFLLVLVIVLVFVLYFFGLAMTFAHISVTQYMSYSAARKLFVAGKSSYDQKISAKEHYEKLRLQFFKTSAHRGQPGDWFSISPKLVTTKDKKDGKDGTLGALGDYTNSHSGRFKTAFYGANVLFISYFFKFKIPFLMESSDSLVQARISSFLGREPSVEDCEWFNKERVREIKKRYSSISNLSIKDNEGKGDNGC